MNANTLIGPNLFDYIEQGPERAGMKNLPESALCKPDGDAVVLAKASPATIEFAFRFVAFSSAFNTKKDAVFKTDSVSAREAFVAEMNYLGKPVARALSDLLGVQMRIDLAAHGVDYTAYPGIGLDRDLNIVGYQKPDPAEMLRQIVELIED